MSTSETPENTRRVSVRASGPFAFSSTRLDVSNGHREVVISMSGTVDNPIRMKPEDARRLAVILNDQADAAEHDVTHEGAES